MTTQTTIEGSNAYRQSLCKDCHVERYLAGHTRCAGCHAIHLQPRTEKVSA